MNARPETEGLWPGGSESLLGVSPPRLEDLRLITGRGLYVADIRIEGMASAVFARAPVAHARIRSIDLEAARAAEGVIAVFGGRDLVEAGVLPLPCVRATASADGRPFHAPIRHAVALDEVRHVGEAVALVVADSEAEAIAAIDLVSVDYETLPANTDPKASTERAFDWEKGDKPATDEAFRNAARIVEIEAVNNRVLISPLEPRGAVALFHPETQSYTLHAPTQGVHLVRRLIAPSLGIEPSKLRVITNDVGGSFGSKLINGPEQTALLFAARAVGRPVKWVATRSENNLADVAGRDHVSTARLALDAEHRILALAVETYGNLGAYASALGPSSPTLGFAATLTGPYDIPAIHLSVHGVYTNTAPTDAYRGSGKPESTYLLERLIDRAGRETGLGPVELRRRNLVAASAMPYRAANGYLYDSADFAAVLERALAAADWSGFPARREASRVGGLRRGIGIGLYIHTTGASAEELSRVRVDPSGVVIVETGLQSGGQGHETAFAQLIAAKLGLKLDQVRIVQGDSLNAEKGGPTAGSSSLQVGGVTMLRAADAMLDKARGSAAVHLEAAPADLVYGAGRFTIMGTDRSIGLFTLAASLEERGEGGCAGEAELAGNILTVPNGAYIGEVEVDPRTGHMSILKFTAVDDVGRRLNPQIVAGQIHGAIAQGIGQAVLEHTVYDPDSAQLITGSLMDYGLPRADDLPFFDLHATDLPTANNPLGMKGAGEIGCIGAPAAIINAIADAIGSDAIDMPATPERIWRACNATPKETA